MEQTFGFDSVCSPISLTIGLHNNRYEDFHSLDFVGSAQSNDGRGVRAGGISSSLSFAQPPSPPFLRGIFTLIVLLTLTLIIFSSKSFAVPASPRPFELKQPSGKTFEARKRGDEWYNWVETKDGYGIYKDTDTGNWEYYMPSDEPAKKETKYQIGRKQDAKKRAVVSEVDPATLGIPKGLRPPRKENGRAWKPTKPKTSPQITPHPSPTPQGERESSLPQRSRLGETERTQQENDDDGFASLNPSYRSGETGDSPLKRGDGGVLDHPEKQPPDSPFSKGDFYGDEFTLLNPSDTFLIPPLEKGDSGGFYATKDSTSTAVSGTMHLLVIGVDYDDTPATYSASEVKSLIFGSSNSVADYYNKVSYSAVTITPATESSGTSNDGFIGWLRLSGNHPNPGSSVGNENKQIAKNAILAADSYIDFASYDTDGDGVVESTELAIVVVVAGYEAASGSNSPSVWAHVGFMYAVGYPKADDKTIQEYAMFGEKHGDHLATFGVVAHELGHHMFKLPDLYDSDGSSAGLGFFCLMASGSWGAAYGEYSGSSPTHLCAWCKEHLSWGTVNTISSSQTISLPKVDNNKSSIFRLNTSDSNQYFLMENREFSGYDIGFQAATGSSGHGGLVIYHVDKLKGVNSDENDKRVDIEEANEGNLGYSMLDSNEYSANTNMFFFSGNNTSFTDTTTPDSKLKNGDSTHISITDISDYGDTMTAYVRRPPTATTGNVTNVTSGAVTLNATVNPYGETATVWFEYGTLSGIYTNTISKQSISGSVDTSISAAINGLSDSTAYYYRVVAQNSVGTIYGSEEVFITGSWTKTTIGSMFTGYPMSLGVDSSGYVHISYSNAGLKYATNASGSWVTTTVNSNVSVGGSSLGMDSLGYVHISYRDESNYDLKYATNVSGSWVITTVDSDGDVGNSCSLGVDSSGHVHISYYDSTNYDLKYATNVSGSWVTTTVDSDGSVGYASSLGVDSSAHVHISYYDRTNYDLKYTTNKSGSWVTTTVDSGGNVGNSSSLGVDSMGYVHISYLDGSNTGLKYATNASGSWVTSAVDSNGKVGNESSLGVDSSGHVHISYYDSTNYDFKYTTNAPGSWVTTTLDNDGYTGSWGYYSSLEVDSSGHVHISYFDRSNYYLKYARSSIDTTKLTDTTAPKGTLNINSKSKYTNNTTITLDLSATDIIGVTGYFISESSSTPSATDSGWTTVSTTPSYSASVSYTVSSGDGTKTVYAWYKDKENNVSNAANDSITLDTTAPTVSITSPTSSDTYTASSSTISLSGSASDSGSGISSATWSNGKGGSGTASGTTSWSISNISLSSGENVITVTAKDGAGNTATDTITVTYTTAQDTTVPTITITSPTSSSTYTASSSTISLSGSASDSGSGISSVTWSNSKGGSGTASGTTSWSISSISLSIGENVITVTAKDGVGNTATDTITVTYTTSTKPTPSTTVTPTPSSTPVVIPSSTQSSTPTPVPTTSPNSTPLSTCTDDYEPNDDFSTAYGPLTLQSSYEGKICTPFDNDYFKIEVASPGIISLALNIPPDKDYDLYLLNANQSLVAFSIYGFGVPEAITYFANTPGTYYIWVFGYGSFDENQTYTLSGTWETTTTLTPTPPLEPTPPPLPTPSATITPPGLCEAESIKTSQARLVLGKRQSGKVTVSVIGTNDCPVEDMIVEVTITVGSRCISVLPVTQQTDENGKATFVIKAKDKIGRAKVTFKAGILEKTLRVRVKRQ